jgi:hypothetical protein
MAVPALIRRLSLDNLAKNCFTGWNEQHRTLIFPTSPHLDKTLMPHEFVRQRTLSPKEHDYL